MKPLSQPSPRRRTTLARATRAAVCTLALLLASPPVFAQTLIRFVEPRVDLVHGRPAVVPVELVDAERAAEGTELRFDDGRTIAVPLVWVGVRTMPVDPQAPPALRWLGPVTRVGVVAADDPAPRPPGGWHALIEAPIDAFGQGIWQGQERTEINWISDPFRTGRERFAGGNWPEGLWAPTPGVDRDPGLRAALGALARSPDSAWRARMALGTLRPERPLAGYADGEDDPAREGWTRGERALASYTEGRWQAALAGLWAADASVAEVTRRRLAGVASIDGALAPAWDPAVGPVDDLLSDLLSPFVEDDARVLRARTWALSRPRGWAWVIDDAGRTDGASGGIAPTIGLVALPSRLGSVLARVETALGEPLLSAAPPGEMLRVTLGIPRTGRNEPPASVGVALGRWSAAMPVRSAPLSARPPGATLGPLLRDWTLPALGDARGDLGAAPVAGAETSVRLTRTAPLGEGAPTEGWTALVLARHDARADASPADRVSIWLGPFGAARMVLEVAPDGVVRTLDASGREVSVSRVPAARELGRWIAWVPIPPEVVGRDGRVRVGVVRDDPRTGRSAWPRRMLPWQDEPGRAEVDLLGWEPAFGSP
ncbi:MAG: hypothetical protein AAF356_03525 [Planctomycetota bacterium]